MAKLRHLAIACQDPDAMADFYCQAFGFKVVRRGDGALAYGVHVSDGVIDLALLRCKTDQLGKGMDYTGMHHFGVLVEDIDETAKKLEALGGKHYMENDRDTRMGAYEMKFYGPEGVLFDVAEHPWTGSAALDEQDKEAAE